MAIQCCYAVPCATGVVPYYIVSLAAVQSIPESNLGVILKPEPVDVVIILRNAPFEWGGPVETVIDSEETDCETARARWL